MRSWLCEKERAGRGLDLFDVVGRDVEDHVDTTGQELCYSRLLVGQRAKDHLLERRRAVPVILICSQGDADVVIPACELERTRPDGILSEVLSECRDRLRTDNSP